MIPNAIDDEDPRKRPTILNNSHQPLGGFIRTCYNPCVTLRSPVSLRSIIICNVGIT
jgi:hypothetical protein